MWSKLGSYLNYLVSTYDLTPVVIELLLIGFAVYSVMRFLRGTGGEKLFKGILFLLFGVLGISLVKGVLDLNLERIGFLFKYFLLAVAVISVVAFQQELRRGLMKLGGAGFGRTELPEMVNVIEQIVDACSALSRKQIGALIALERQVGLSDLVSIGTSLDAEVTEDLLETIFWPGSPLHDMGVLIRSNRLAAAGVQFPLAEHGEYDRILGSRHRAAIGMSKATDAVVVVVSEETGQIGLAVEGKLARFLTLEQLRRQLLDLMVPATMEKSKKKWFGKLGGSSGVKEKPESGKGKSEPSILEKA